MKSINLTAVQRQRLELLRMVCDVWHASTVRAEYAQGIAFGCAAGAIHLAWECPDMFRAQELIFLRELIGNLYTERLKLD